MFIINHHPLHTYVIQLVRILLSFILMEVVTVVLCAFFSVNPHLAYYNASQCASRPSAIDNIAYNQLYQDEPYWPTIFCVSGKDYQSGDSDPMLTTPTAAPTQRSTPLLALSFSFLVTHALSSNESLYTNDKELRRQFSLLVCQYLLRIDEGKWPSGPGDNHNLSADSTGCVCDKVHCLKLVEISPSSINTTDTSTVTNRHLRTVNGLDVTNSSLSNVEYALSVTVNVTVNAIDFIDSNSSEGKDMNTLSPIETAMNAITFRLLRLIESDCFECVVTLLNLWYYHQNQFVTLETGFLSPSIHFIGIIPVYDNTRTLIYPTLSPTLSPIQMSEHENGGLHGIALMSLIICAVGVLIIPVIAFVLYRKTICCIGRNLVTVAPPLVVTVTPDPNP